MNFSTYHNVEQPLGCYEPSTLIRWQNLSLRSRMLDRILSRSVQRFLFLLFRVGKKSLPSRVWTFLTDHYKRYRLYMHARYCKYIPMKSSWIARIEMSCLVAIPSYKFKLIFKIIKVRKFSAKIYITFGCLSDDILSGRQITLKKSSFKKIVNWKLRTLYKRI